MSKTLVIDYPPGCLGNFVAQILTNSVNYTLTDMQYHRTANVEYDSLIPDSADKFLKELATWSPKYNVAICHAFGHIAELKNKIDCLVWQIQPNTAIIPFFLNRILKADSDNPNAEELNNAHIMSVWGETSNWIKRENYALQYKWLTNEGQYKSTLVDKVINFDNFYAGTEEFHQEINKINSSVDADNLYKHFHQTQKPILDKVNFYNSILACIKTNTDASLVDLTLLDQGILSGMLSERYPSVEWHLPNQDRWFPSTIEISNIIDNR